MNSMLETAQLSIICIFSLRFSIRVENNKNHLPFGIEKDFSVFLSDQQIAGHLSPRRI